MMSDDRQRIEAAWHLIAHPTLHDAHGNGWVRCDAVAEALTGPQEGTGATQSDAEPKRLSQGGPGTGPRRLVSDGDFDCCLPTVARLLAAAPKWEAE